METIIGRDQELAMLREIYESTEPQFLAVYGRRRIGKTYLISEFFKNKGVYFEITGMKEGTMAEQLFQFAYEFSRQFNEGKRITPPKSWAQALNLLHEAVEKVEKGRKIILFFDELPWLASPRSKFLNALEHFWNRYLSRNKNVILIVCGSSASWIIRKIINNKGGLHGRVTRKMRLLPFTLLETEAYLKSRHIELDRKQIIDLYMAIGGVPKYLSYLTRGKSAAQLINDVCFSLNGGLYHEFDNLYKSLFENYEHHVSIVKALAKAIDGLTKDELLDKVNLASGGSSSRMIEDLVDAGFLIYVPSFNKKKVGGIYRLTDEYSLFYLTWIAENSSMSLESVDSEFWLKKQAIFIISSQESTERGAAAIENRDEGIAPAISEERFSIDTLRSRPIPDEIMKIAKKQRTSKWNAWSGCAFESVCLKHIQNIKKALGISGISTIESGWRYLPNKAGQQGAQIDLVIDRADKCMNLCEMKYSDSEFVIDKPYVEKLQNKKKVFREQTGTAKTLFTTMVTTYGVKKNAHSLSAIDNQLTMDALFC